jgi:integrase
VGTMVERELGVGAASAQLGHSGIAVTERHYIERAALAPDTSAILQRLGDLVQ